MLSLLPRNMKGNPSECFFGYNPRTDSKEILCSCAKGYIDYDHGSCMPVECEYIINNADLKFTAASHFDHRHPCPSGQ